MARHFYSPCWEPTGEPSVESLLRSSGVRLPSLSATIGYTARIRTEAILRHSFYRAVTGFKKMLKQPVTRGEEDLRGLKEGMAQIKRETRQALAFHLKDYQENLKFKYLFRLAETAAERLSQAVTGQLQAYSADFGALADRLSSKQEDKQRDGRRFGGYECALPPDRGRPRPAQAGPGARCFRPLSRCVWAGGVIRTAGPDGCARTRCPGPAVSASR